MTRMNIALTILEKEVEDFLNIAVFALLVEEFEPRRSPVGLPRSLGVAAELAELPESPMTRIEQQGSREGGGARSPSLGTYPGSASRIFASWKQIAGWLRALSGLRIVA